MASFCSHTRPGFSYSFFPYLHRIIVPDCWEVCYPFQITILFLYSFFTFSPHSLLRDFLSLLKILQHCNELGHLMSCRQPDVESQSITWQWTAYDVPCMHYWMRELKWGKFFPSRNSQKRLGNSREKHDN